jgi:hypothetical protein
MPRLRARVWVTALALGAMVTLTRAQNPVSTGFTVVEGLGLPAVDLDALVGEPHPINTASTRRVAAFESAMSSTARIGPSGAAYAPGRVLVKFRGGAAPTVTTESLRITSASATLSTRPAYADFDVVRIDAGEDAQQVAAALRQRSDVEWAQPAYYMHANLVPNDPDYQRGRQWHLTLIDIERAWDIQPTAGS